MENFDDANLEEEKKQLQNVDSFVIIEYIKSSIEILLSLKLEEQEKDLSVKKKKLNDVLGRESLPSI